MLRAALLCAVLSAAAATSDPPKVPIPDFVKLECSLSQLAFEFGSARVPSSPAALHDALNLGSCAGHMDAATLAENQRILAAAPPVRGELPGAGTTLYVATTGSDSGAGTEASPFATLHGAAAAIRKAGASGSTTVLVRAGKYYFNETLTLGKADSNVRWAAYSGEKVTLSGGKLLAPDWKPYKGKIQMASVSPSDVLSAPEREYLGAPAPAPAPRNFGKPPAQWNTLHVDGVRQVRARFPNGDPQQGSGICFSKINRPGEGCDSYLQARGGLGCTFDPAGRKCSRSLCVFFRGSKKRLYRQPHEQLHLATGRPGGCAGELRPQPRLLADPRLQAVHHLRPVQVRHLHPARRPSGVQ